MQVKSKNGEISRELMVQDLGKLDASGLFNAVFKGALTPATLTHLRCYLLFPELTGGYQ